MIEISSILDVEAHLEGINAVIFDLDDTLYPEKSYVRSGFRAIAAEFGDPSLEEKLWQVFLAGGKAIDEVFAREGLSFRKEEALHCYRFHQPQISLYPGATELLERIGKTKKIGIITDGRPEGQRAKLQALGIRADRIIITDELGGIACRKPCTLAFRKMQEFFNVPFSEMVYIGDNPKKDFIAPKTLGMKQIWFHNPDGLYN